ncbi:hypothetical protein M514_27538 [Trichuris suis]|uniref:Oxidoreductase, short chain dehydrogenase/reductase family protein n=1 Tax=Trichuris suis TaxID=68888 RepID=A0A085MST9_9BILA|nr:hypothetical protein M514_27538 [Trichuris suis]
MRMFDVDTVGLHFASGFFGTGKPLTLTTSFHGLLPSLLVSILCAKAFRLVLGLSQLRRSEQPVHLCIQKKKSDHQFALFYPSKHTHKMRSHFFILLLCSVAISVIGLDIEPTDPNATIAGRFSGKTLLVTGGARGMGRATAIRAAREGANVVIADWLDKEGQETAEEIQRNGGNAIYVHTDVSNTKDTYAMVEAAVSKFGSLDLALNAAGVIDGVYSGHGVDLDAQDELLFRKIHEATDKYFDKVMAINAGGAFKSLRAELAQMVKQGKGGAIVTIGSSTAIAAQSAIPAYVASKHAISGLIRSAAIDYARYGIRVNSVNMANTDTDLLKRFREVLKKRINFFAKCNVGSSFSYDTLNPYQCEVSSKFAPFKLEDLIRMDDCAQTDEDVSALKGACSP